MNRTATQHHLVVLAALTVIAALTLSAGCTGGCYDDADPVTTDPATACLLLFAGQSATDPTVCGNPKLAGENDCTEALTLPPRSTGGPAVVVAPGARIFYPLSASLPGVTLTGRVYTIVATVGANTFTMSVSTHRQ